MTEDDLTRHCRIGTIEMIALARYINTYAYKNITYCDGFAQARKPRLLGKHVPTKDQPTTEGHPLLGNGPVNISRGNEYGKNRVAVHC
jgi:hypothetical protein